ncbi:hypothetical protein [Mucilaginibacter puniceus]
MKKLTKLAAAALTGVALLIGSNAKAQTNPSSAFRFGIGLEAGVPTGNASNVSNFSLGGTARLQYGLTNDLALTLTSGYYNMFGKHVAGSSTIKYGDIGIVPLKAGIKAFFAQNLYFGAEVGAGFETNSGGSTKFIASPALGWANKTWDVSARYENFAGQNNNYGLVGLRLAYGFKL